jgi:hypothetical protein
MNSNDVRALDVLARSPDGATEHALGLQGVPADVVSRLVQAAYVHHAIELFARPNGAAASRFYITSAGRKARASADLTSNHDSEEQGRHGIPGGLGAESPPRSGPSRWHLGFRKLAYACATSLFLITIALVVSWTGLLDRMALQLLRAFS